MATPDYFAHALSENSKRPRRFSKRQADGWIYQEAKKEISETRLEDTLTITCIRKLSNVALTQ